MVGASHGKSAGRKHGVDGRFAKVFLWSVESSGKILAADSVNQSLAARGKELCQTISMDRTVIERFSSMEDAAHDAIETIAPSAPDSWIARLQGNQVTRDEAIEELRRILLRGLSKSFGAGNSVGMHLEDVVQEALLKVLESLQQFQGRSRFTTWAMTIATRIAISKRRRKHFADVSLDSLSRDRGTTFDVTSVEQSPAEVVDQQGTIAVLQQLIDEVLTDRQRVAIRALLDGLPVEVIAEKTESNRNSVYKLIHDAKLKLRSGLEAAGVASDDLNFGTH